MLRKIWIELRSSLWFVPGLLVCAGIALALGLVELDVIFYEPLRAKGWKSLLSAGEEGARGMLAAIAGSMITVAGVAFSITIVTLSLASTQYTPRILRNFMRDRANQFVLGIFVAVFTYCLIVSGTMCPSLNPAARGDEVEWVAQPHSHPMRPARAGKATPAGADFWSPAGRR